VSPVDISALADEIAAEPIEPIILPSVRAFAASGIAEPDHVCTADDFVTGATARFDANLAAIEVLQSMEASSRQASPDEQQVLARFSGFGDSTFEPAFRLTPMRKEDQPWVERGQRLRELVDDSEWESLQRSRLNAFFTTPEVIGAIWEGLVRLGIGDLPDPRILEPAAGVGRFLGLQPPEIAERSHRTAIELDVLTAGLLKQLYPRVAVHVLGFQDAPLRDDWFDVAVSNVPFGDFPVVDGAFLKASQRFFTRSIHNYFFVKSLTKLRPGGVLAFITSRYTLDAPSAEPVRRHLQQSGDLLAAVRLPSGIFPDTDVVTDLVLMRKRLSNERDGDDGWVRSVPQTFAYQRPPRPNASGQTAPEEIRCDVNAYFVAHPELVLGTQDATSAMHGGAMYTVKLPPAGRDPVIAALRETMQALPSNVVAPRQNGAAFSLTPMRQEAPMAEANTALREGAYAIIGDALLVRRDGRLVDPQLSPSQAVRVRGLLAVRDAARSALRAQLDGAGLERIEQTQRRLNAAYDQFVFRFGPLNSPPNVAAMASDPDAFFLRALERRDTEAQQHQRTGRPVSDQAARERLKMPLFHDIVVRQARPATRARSARDAFLITLNELGTLDFARMAELLGSNLSPDFVRDQLAADGLVFEDPEGSWLTADAYLSGNVKHRLAVAEKAAGAEPRYDRNVEALRVVIPSDIPPGQIEVRLGTHWIPATDFNQFLVDVLDAEEPRWSHSSNQFVRYVALSRAGAPKPV
jgi:hypothetical protein